MAKLKYVCDVDARASHICPCGQKAEQTVVLEGTAEDDIVVRGDVIHTQEEGLPAKGRDNWTHYCASCLREVLADLRREVEARRSERWLQKAVWTTTHGIDPDDFCTSCGYRRGKCKCH
jgi:hypothetical protein